jgi:hypothetical protein
MSGNEPIGFRVAGDENSEVVYEFLGENRESAVSVHVQSQDTEVYSVLDQFSV